jgi:hypothetical protein
MVDVEGHRQEPAVAALIAKLASRCDVVKVLGSYPRFTPRPRVDDEKVERISRNPATGV